jgi:hypothetical protein
MNAPVQAIAAVALASARITPGRVLHVDAGQKDRPAMPSYEQRYRARLAFTTGNGLHHHGLSEGRQGRDQMSDSGNRG